MPDASRTGTPTARMPPSCSSSATAYPSRCTRAISARQDDLHITGGLSAFIGAAFFLGYFAFQVPGALYAERRSVKNLIFWSLIAWGVLASVQGLLTNVTALIVVRFLVGVVEAAVLPAMVIFLSHWFTKGERGRANTFLILGNPVTVLWLSVVSGYLIELTSWRGMFIIEGIPAVIWAFVFRKMVADRPRDAAWLDPAERDAVESTSCWTSCAWSWRGGAVWTTPRPAPPTPTRSRARSGLRAEPPQPQAVGDDEHRARAPSRRRRSSG